MHVSRPIALLIEPMLTSCFWFVRIRTARIPLKEFVNNKYIICKNIIINIQQFSCLEKCDMCILTDNHFWFPDTIFISQIAVCYKSMKIKIVNKTTKTSKNDRFWAACCNYATTFVQAMKKTTQDSDTFCLKIFIKLDNWNFTTSILRVAGYASGKFALVFEYNSKIWNKMIKFWII